MADFYQKYSAKLEYEPNTGCILWTTSHFHDGYGQIWFNNKTMRAHRASYLSQHGSIPDKKLVCHKCDTPACVNHEHLFLGTFKDNMQDKLKKKRHPWAKITHCPHGHEYTKENSKLYFNKLKAVKKRSCRTCCNEKAKLRAQTEEYKEKRRPLARKKYLENKEAIRKYQNAWWAANKGKQSL